VIGIVLAVAALFSVLALGAVDMLAFAPVQVAVALLAVWVFWQKGLPRLSIPTWSILGMLCLLPLLQLIPLPRVWTSAIMPERVVLAEALLGPIDSLPASLTLSASPYETRLALLRMICYVLVFLLAFAAQRFRRERFGLAAALLVIGVLEASYGCFQFLTGQQYAIRFREWQPALNASGTFVNRNHFAGLLEMIIPFLLAQILFVKWVAGSSRRSPWVEMVVSPLSSRLLVRIVLLALLTVALVFSRSRMGILAGLVGMLVVCAIVFLQTRRRSMLLVFVLVFSLPVAYSVWIGLTPVIERFEGLTDQRVLEQQRLPVWRDTASLIRDYPITGTGLGTYRWSSQHYQTAFFNSLYQHAHNDYLEFASEIGVPAAALLFGALWALAIRVARRALTLESVREKVLASGCAGAMTALLVHGITDFNLQIPANAFIFSWIAGTAAALLHRPKRELQAGASGQAVILD
jgi:O-antigen ligase